jgi:hypothetical protein
VTETKTQICNKIVVKHHQDLLGEVSR